MTTRLQADPNECVTVPPDRQGCPAVRGSRWITLAALVGVIFTLLVIPLAICARGYTPEDDARRHVAKVISGKSWQDIVVMRPEVTIDQNPGWHAVLGACRRIAGLSQDGLMLFSILALFVVFAVSALPGVRHPEAWALALLAAFVAMPDIVPRYLLGRPFLFSSAALIVLLDLWRYEAVDRRAAIRRAVISVVLLALATWIHGSWYLFGLLVMAMVLTGRVRDGLHLGGCWVGGVVLGAAFTGEPAAFLTQQVDHLFSAFGRGLPPALLAGEFKAYHVSGGCLAGLAVLLACAIWRRKSLAALRRDPVLMLALLGFCFGMRSARAWLDWGLPAALVWVSHELDGWLTVCLPRIPRARLGLTAAVCLALIGVTYQDYQSRWSTRRFQRDAVASKLVNATDWLPGPGGILYSASMRTFFDLFYRFPEAPWRYALAYEPGLMTEENFQVFLNIQRHGYRPDTVAPWVRRMGANDRLVIAVKAQPALPALDWHPLDERYWIGRTRLASRAPREVSR